MRIGNNLCKPYVKCIWQAVNRWATWEPGNQVEVGTVGVFSPRLEFHSKTTLGKLDIGFASSPDNPIGDRLYYSQGQFDVTVKGSGQAPMPGSALLQADMGVTLVSRRRWGAALQVTTSTESRLLDEDDVLRQVQQLLASGRWNPRWCIVTYRIRAQGRTAIVTRGKGGRIEFRADTSIPAAPVAELAGRARLVHTTGVTYDIAQNQTPLFGEPIRVKRGLWPLTLHLYDTAGFKYGDGNTMPTEPSASPETVQGRTRKDRGKQLTPMEVMAMSTGQLFERVTLHKQDLLGLGGWYDLAMEGALNVRRRTGLGRGSEAVGAEDAGRTGVKETEGMGVEHKDAVGVVHQAEVDDRPGPVAT